MAVSKYVKRAFLALMVGVSLVLAGCGQIEEGHVGVRTELGGKIVQEPLRTGFYTAVMSSVEEFTTKEIILPLQNLTPKASDNLSLERLDVAIYYKVNGDLVPRFQSEKGSMSKKYGDVWAPGIRLVENLALGTINDSVSKIASLKLHTQREALEADVLDRLQEQLDKSDPGLFTITRVVVTALDTDDAVEDSIRLATQADMRFTAAEKEVQIRKQQALANDALNASLTPEFLQSKYIDAIATCAANAGCTLVVDGSESAKMLNLR